MAFPAGPQTVINRYRYAKAEQHFIPGSGLNFEPTLNPGGLQPSSKFSVLKIGVSF
jgi:hypothetical protein